MISQEEILWIPNENILRGEVKHDAQKGGGEVFRKPTQVKYLFFPHHGERFSPRAMRFVLNAAPL
jgi:hypothetical protein